MSGRNKMRVEVDQSALGSYTRAIIPKVTLNGADVHYVVDFSSQMDGLGTRVTLTFVVQDLEVVEVGE